MKKTLLTLAFGSVLCLALHAQTIPTNHPAYYPISDDPNISYKTSMTPYETILFEANPIVHYSFFNNIYQFGNTPADVTTHKQAWYFLYKPELRMYTDNSLPVKMPSYRILVGTQHFWRLRGQDLIGFSLESGHYSNGQDGGAFTTKYADNTPQNDSVYNTITPKTNLSALLNRKSGNFSTDETDLVFSYLWNKKLDGNYDPVTTHALKLGLTLYHDRIFGLLPVGGYSLNDIRIYGKWRTELGYKFSHTYFSGWRISASENIETIYNAHPWVQPWRFESVGTIYPFHNMTDFGFFATFIWGHDNYNYRFVDSGHQYGLGISWNLFPPIPVHGANP